MMTLFGLILGLIVGVSYIALFGYWGWYIGRPYDFGGYGLALGAIFGPLGIAVEYWITERIRRRGMIEPVHLTNALLQDDCTEFPPLDYEHHHLAGRPAHHARWN